MPAMTDRELAAVVNERLALTSVNLTTAGADRRAKALRYYRGDLFGHFANVEEGQSRVVSRDVQEVVDGLMPSLLKVFSSGDAVCEFVPRQAQDAKAASQATDYVNWLWENQDEGGFLTFYTWFKDALLNGLSVLKIWWDETDLSTTETYEGQTQEEVALLLMTPHLEIEARADYPDPDPPSGTEPKTLSDVTVRVSAGKGRVRRECIPMDQFIYDWSAPSFAKARIKGHREQYTISDLREMGYPDDVLAQLPSGDAAFTAPERLARYGQETGGTMLADWVDSDPASRLIWVSECYLHVDYDGDGVAELRKVTSAGPENAVILDNAPAADDPFAILAPVLMPHRIDGMSIADQTMDLQDIKTALWRGALDNLYLTNAPRHVVDEGMFDVDSLLSARPGGVVQRKPGGQIEPLVVPFVAQHTLGMVQYADQVRELRTGLPRVGGELNDQVLNSSATGAQLVNTARLERVELIARTFAETGVKDAFRKMLALVQRHQDTAQVIRLRGEFVAMDPREWRTQFDLTCKVGLGAGNKDQMLMHLMPVKQTQEQLLLQLGPENPLVNLGQYYNTLCDMIRNAGLGSAERYFSDPAKVPQWKPPPHPAAAEGQAKQQAAQQQIAMQQQADQQRFVLDQQRAQHELQMAQAKAELDGRLAQQKAQLEAELAQQKLTQQTTLAQQQAQHDMEMQRTRAMADIQIKRDAAAAQIEINRQREATDLQTDVAKARAGAGNVA